MAPSSDGRWAFAGSPEAEVVDAWMRPGLGLYGARHAALLHLVRMRQSNARDEELAFRPIDEIHAEAIAWRGFAEADTLEILEELAREQLVEARASGGAPSSWRATPTAVAAIEVAYAKRHPLVEEPPPG